MTALEVYDLVTLGGDSDFAQVIRVRVRWRLLLIGGLAVNCYVEPVYTVDAEIVVDPSQTSALALKLEDPEARSSKPRIQFTTDRRYQDFPSRAQRQAVLGTEVSLPVWRTWPKVSFGPMGIRRAGSVNARKTSWT